VVSPLLGEEGSAHGHCLPERQMPTITQRLLKNATT
jgi:hypothetical protein